MYNCHTWSPVPCALEMSYRVPQPTPSHQANSPVFGKKYAMVNCHCSQPLTGSARKIARVKRH